MSATSTGPAQNPPFPMPTPETPLQQAERAAKIARWAFADAERAEFRTKQNHEEAVITLDFCALNTGDLDLRHKRSKRVREEASGAGLA